MSGNVFLMIFLYAVLMTVIAIVILLLIELITGYVKACRKCKETRKEALNKFTKTLESK